MVETKKEEVQEPKMTFGYEKDGEQIAADATSFSQLGQIYFNALLELQNNKNKLVLAVEDADILMNHKKQWILDNEINKEEDSEVEEAEVVEDVKGDSNGKS